jgi:pimeloyl-ACP methyl ester carboxylesterase
MRAFVRSMFVPTSDPTLVERVVAGMSAAPPHIGIGAAKEAWEGDRQLQEGLLELIVPKIAINNASVFSTNMEAAQRHGVEVVLTAGVGHFVMMEEPQTFNRLLDEAVQKCIHAGARQ